MMVHHTITIQSHSLSDTTHLAGCFAPLLQAGHIFGLSGDLGAGKSAFSRAVIQARCPDVFDVPSPTFTLVQHYDTPDGLVLWHMDLYRLTLPEDVFALGIEDAFYEAACLIEWPDKMAGYWPSHAAMITITRREDDTREFQISADGSFISSLHNALADSALSFSISS